MTVVPPASGVTLHDGDTMDVTGDISVDSTWILTGGSQTVGGSSATSTATNTNIFGGEQDVVFNGVASYTTIFQGVQRVTGSYVHEGPSPGRADHTAIDGGEQDVDTGIATATRVNSGGTQNVTNGGSATGTIVESGGVLKVSGETVETAPVYPEPVIRSVATAATINYQGEFDVTGGGTAVNAVVKGGAMTVSGSIPDPFASVPGQPAVDASTATGTIVENGGTLAVSNGALVSGTIVQIFGSMKVDAGGTATGTTLDLGTMQLSAGATATDTIVNQGGVLVVLGGADFSGTVFNAGSTLEIGDGTSETGFIVANGVTLDVLDGGILTGGIVSAGGTLILEAGATFSDTTFQSGATFVVEFGYAESDFTVSDGITFKVLGTATNTTILAGGKQIVGNFGEGGSATNTVINGGEQDVELLATASYTTINKGGIQHVAGLYIHDEPGPGRADHTTVNNGGEQDVDTGIVTATIVNAGGVQNLTNGGIASDTIVKSGGVINASGETVYYSPGGYFATVIRSEFDSADVGSGGQMHLSGAGIAKNTTIDGGVMTVSGSIPDPVTNDPNAPAVDASEASGTILNSGSISVSDGGIVTSTTLNGGTLDVLDQGTANASTIYHGATEFVEAGGIAGATTIAGGMLDLKAGAIADDAIIFSGQGMLRIEQKLVAGASTFASQIKGIALGDEIDLSGLSYTDGATATVSGSTLMVSNGTASETFTLADTSITHFGITKDGTGGILLTAAAGPTMINGPASGHAIIEGTTGNDIIHAYGMFNIIHSNGGNDAIYAGLYGTVDMPSGDSTVHLEGFDNRVTGGDGNIAVTGSTGATTMTLGSGNDTIDASGYGNIITLGNGKDIVHPGDGASTTTAGNGNDQVMLSGFGNKVVLGNGDDVVTGGDGANSVTLGDGNNTVTLDGMVNQITVGSGTNTILAGNGLDSVVAGAGHDTITLGGVANHVVLNGSTADVTNQIGQDIVTANGGSDQFHFVGFGNQAIINGPAHVDIIDHSSGLTVSVNSANQVDTISGFGNDALGVIQLANGVGVYHSVADIMSALRSDGHGGTLLALGSAPHAGSIDFVDAAASQLHAANFMIV